MLYKRIIESIKLLCKEIVRKIITSKTWQGELKAKHEWKR